ncbi:flagellar biosynthetic protein FliO [Parashewanella spongiae]|uniref:Flagellar protein n=1 Tax=Parashewanella spongiae TaxID=342950 RepID=A0A3A6UC40_9GAMM|nr:flagellar biosynthetic protein FliO [Parashewanella spongiae]MCL1076641.1 flagellar biosynthetic protein FliO [Parashewanella spongiae]RJY19594.1 flagellar biosynthetic protein FliO [Parashewanella spongiae]
MSSLFITTIASVSAETPKIAESSDMVSSLAGMMGGLFVVLGVIFVLAYIVRRFNLAPSSNGALKTVAVAPLGQKEKVVLLEVEGKQYLLGVTPHNVSLIDKIEDPIKVKAETFANKLRQAKAGKNDASA